jgi:hypothetical protein
MKGTKLRWNLTMGGISRHASGLLRVLQAVMKINTVEPQLSEIKGADPILDKQYFG